MTALSFRVVHKRRASQDVVRQIQDLLTSGRLRPGDRLPSERDLAHTLHVGRSTVREAYRSLEALGIIKVQPGIATCVAEVPVSARLVPINGTSPRGAWDHRRELIEARLVLDPPAAALAARRATAEQLAKFRAILEAQEVDLASGGSGLEADGRFHALLFDASGNPILGDLAGQVTTLLREIQEDVATQDHGTLSLTQHRLIFEAVEAREPERAKQRMRAHLQTLERLLPGTLSH